MILIHISSHWIYHLDGLLRLELYGSHVFLQQIDIGQFLGHFRCVLQKAVFKAFINVIQATAGGGGSVKQLVSSKLANNAKVIAYDAQDIAHIYGILHCNNFTINDSVVQAEMGAVENIIDMGNILWIFYDCLQPIDLDPRLPQLMSFLLKTSHWVLTISCWWAYGAGLRFPSHSFSNHSHMERGGSKTNLVGPSAAYCQHPVLKNVFVTHKSILYQSCRL